MRDKDAITPYEDDVYVTRDINEAAVLHASGVLLKGVKHEANGMCYFEFPGYAECGNAVMDYRNGIKTVNAKNFVGSLRLMKDIIHGESNYTRR